MATKVGEEKDILWMGSSYADLLAFPKAPRGEAGFQLGKVQAGLDKDIAAARYRAVVNERKGKR